MIEPLIVCGTHVFPITNIDYMYPVPNNHCKLYISLKSDDGIESQFESREARDEWYKRFKKKFALEI
jgi:hypothetical protein